MASLHGELQRFTNSNEGPIYSIEIEDKVLRNQQMNILKNIQDHTLPQTGCVSEWGWAATDSIFTVEPRRRSRTICGREGINKFTFVASEKTFYTKLLNH
jgi:hypothetical protein